MYLSQVRQNGVEWTIKHGVQDEAPEPLKALRGQREQRDAPAAENVFGKQSMHWVVESWS